ncbi:MAG: pullulanase-type alpha-1,6-glucosidase [Chloroflexaceae bacterium]|nr:pullulanase-type alpha-1,6-glucosidase [Chloroflexaceae bacterium]
MLIHRWMRVAMFVPLLALVLSSLPFQHPAVLAGHESSNVLLPESESIALAQEEPAITFSADLPDREMVVPALQNPNQDEVFYFVLPDRFNDADPTNNVGDDPGGTTEADILRHGYYPQDKGYYHGGDMQGITERLDYLQELGITAIWMAPVLKNRPVQGPPDITNPATSAGYHGYWTIDYTSIDPHFGSNADLQTLIDEAHARGMKVFFDIITNHTADVIQYEPNSSEYRSKEEFPYRDAEGNPFNDRNFVNQVFPDMDPAISFPYRPVFATPEDATVKKPDWLNNPELYHNRGNTDFVGEDEDSVYGDFFGLDDLFTERPEVVEGMKDIFKTWIRDYRIDGFRIDTVKHVNIEFWQDFIPEIEQYAHEGVAEDGVEPIPEFFMFAEAYIEEDVPYLSYFTTEGTLPSALDFPFQTAIRNYVSRGQTSEGLRNFFARDDLYTDFNSNVYRLPTFTGNHDMGRFGYFLTQDDPDATNDELLARTRLAHGMLYFARGMPVIYYGDEQGFIGDGNDKDARETMFGTVTESYLDNEFIGSDISPAEDKFIQTHPIYEALQQFGQVYQQHRTLRYGAQIHRYSSEADGGDIYAFSRIDRNEQVEYVIAFNNAAATKTATFDTFFNPDVYAGVSTFEAVYPADNPDITTNITGELTLSVPPVDVVIYRSVSALGARDSAPNITITAPLSGTEVFGPVFGDRVEVAAELDQDSFAEVTFLVKIGDANEYTYVGTDNNAPYRVYYDVTNIAVGTALTFKAIVNDLNLDVYGGFNVDSDTTVVNVVEKPAEPVPPCVSVDYAIIHYNRPDGDYDGWGVYLFGPGVDESELTTWPETRPFAGEDAFGRFAFVKVKDANQQIGFIIQNNGVKDTEPDRFFVPAQNPQIWIKQGDETIYTSQAAAQGYATAHYNRPGGDYDGWGLYLFGEGVAESELTTWPENRPFTGSDDFGVTSQIELANPEAQVGFIVQNNGTKDTDPDRFFTPAQTPSIWLKQGDGATYTSEAAAENMAVIHYRRPDGDYGDYTSDDFTDFWGLHVWTGAANPTDWPAPIKPAGTDAFGVYFEVALVEGATELAYILHRGDEKDQPADQFLDLGTYGHEVWVLQGVEDYILPIVGGGCGVVAPEARNAYWEDKDTIVWEGIEANEDNVYRLYYSPDGGMTIDEEFGSVEGGEFKELALVQPPQLSQDATGPARFDVLNTTDVELRTILQSQTIVTENDTEGRLINATGVLAAGALDDLYSAAVDEPLGVVYDGTVPTLRLWAPTAQSVSLQRFADSTTAVSTTVPMTFDATTGIWSAEGSADWTGQYYLYSVAVYVPSLDEVVTNLVTDPYSFSLSTNSQRSQIVDLNASNLKPSNWDDLDKPALRDFADVVLYELHVRDFSVSDPSVPEEQRGTFAAFTNPNTNGMQHLINLAEAGLSHVHLLPVFDIATVNEDKSAWQQPDLAALEAAAPDSEIQQALVAAVQEEDPFNWGYDPYHYTVPEGSYSTNPDGTTRIVEFREMVQSLNTNGLRVVMDVVYNHTNASGQNERSVLDKIVPEYYHRLNDDGTVQQASCCPDTATEHAMMEKLMIDSLRVWATQYKVDGFRFDLMGFHTVENMVNVRQMLDSLTLTEDGVDGAKIFVYGEGWDFGGLSNNPDYTNATQVNLGNTAIEIGTFNDRLRDAARGGSPVDGPSIQDQGFVTGLVYDANGVTRGTEQEQAERLLLFQDQIRVGLTGNLRDYTLTNRNGDVVRGAEIPYGGSPTGYTTDPQQAITYVEAHDNETLFDVIQLKAAATATLVRARADAEHGQQPGAAWAGCAVHPRGPGTAALEGHGPR